MKYSVTFSFPLSRELHQCQLHAIIVYPLNIVAMVLDGATRGSDSDSDSDEIGIGVSF